MTDQGRLDLPGIAAVEDHGRRDPSRLPALDAAAIEPGRHDLAEARAPAAAHQGLADIVVQRHLEPVAAGPAMDGGAHLIGQRRIHPLVGLDFQHPLPQAGGRPRGLSLAFQREDPIDHPRAELARDLL